MMYDKPADNKQGSRKEHEMTRSREERDARRQYFAIWSNKFAYALEVYPEEIDSFLRDFKKFKHIYPNFSGPYPTGEEAMQVAKSRKITY
jgi:hypothetical protein